MTVSWFWIVPSHAEVADGKCKEDASPNPIISRDRSIRTTGRIGLAFKLLYILLLTAFPELILIPLAFRLLTGYSDAIEVDIP